VFPLPYGMRIYWGSKCFLSWIIEDDGTVLIYYVSSDTRMHVATTTVNQLLDYVKNTPEDDLYSHFSVQKINQLIESNSFYCKF